MSYTIKLDETIDEATTIIHEDITQFNNADAIAHTYYEYHGKHDDGLSPADVALPFGFSEVMA